MVLAVVALASAPACYRGSADVTESGAGLPVVRVEFPPQAAPGSTHTAVLHVDNPGPGDIDRVVVAFANVGAPAVEGLPHPLAGAGRSPTSGAVLDVDPSPSSISEDGVIYRFGFLSEGASLDIRFELRVPRAPGVAASSVTVYDDVEPDRARGVRLETVVEG